MVTPTPVSDAVTAGTEGLIERIQKQLAEEEGQGFTHCCDSSPVTFADLRARGVHMGWRCWRITESGRLALQEAEGR